MSQQPPGWVPPGDAGPSWAAAPGGDVPPGHPPPGPGLPGPAPGSYAQPWAPAYKPGVVALRPLGLGDLFDGAFRTIRANPRAMVGLAAVVTTVFMLVPVLVTLVLAATGNLGVDLFGSGGGGSLGSGTFSVVSNLGSLFGALATVVLTGMLVHVVAEAVLGRRTTIGAAWLATRGRLLRLVGLTLLDGLVALLLLGVPVGVGVGVGVTLGLSRGLLVGVPLLLAGVVLLALVQVRLFLLAPPALVLEQLGVLASVRRARELSRGQFWRLFGIYLLTALVVGLVGNIVTIPLTILGVVAAAMFPGTGGGLALVFAGYVGQVVVGAVTTPFAAAVVSLQYVDQRIRKEGLDVQLIAAARQPPPGPR